MLFELVRGTLTSPEKIQEAVNKAVARNLKKGYQLKPVASPVLVGRTLYYSLWFCKPGQSPVSREFDKQVARGAYVHPTLLEAELMKCRGTKRINQGQRLAIKQANVTMEDVGVILDFYESHRGLPIDEQCKRGMKRTFNAIVGDLDGQLEIAQGHRAAAQRMAEKFRKQPQWNWRKVRNELAARGEAGFAGRTWNELNDQQRQRIISLK